MYLSPYETEMVCRQHRKTLLQEAERDRLLAPTHALPQLIQRVLFGLGRALVAAGTWLEKQGTPAPALGHA